MVSITPAGTNRRNDDTYVCKVLGADGGGSSPHKASINVPVGTTSPARNANSSSTARSLGGVTRISTPSSPKTRNGPNSPTCTNRHPSPTASPAPALNPTTAQVG